MYSDEELLEWYGSVVRANNGYPSSVRSFNRYSLQHGGPSYDTYLYRFGGMKKVNELTNTPEAPDNWIAPCSNDEVINTLETIRQASGKIPTRIQIIAAHERGEIPFSYKIFLRMRKESPSLEKQLQEKGLLRPQNGGRKPQ